MKPRILLIGAGRFGRRHLRALQELEREGRVTLAGVVVRSERSREAIMAECTAPIHVGFTERLLTNVDAVDIVTPHTSHAPLLRACLPHVSAFVEKPLADSRVDAEDVARIAREHGRVLMVGHIYRFAPLARALADAIHDLPVPWAIRARFIKPTAEDTGEQPALEFLHLPDVVDLAIGGQTPTVIRQREHGRVVCIDARYPGYGDAHFELGWKGMEKTVTLEARSGGTTLMADFVAKTLTRVQDDVQEEIPIPSGEEPLRQELIAFLNALDGTTPAAGFPDAETGIRLVTLAERHATASERRRPRIAIVGGGIFGASCAIELGDDYDVTLFERNSDIMTEASFVNQYRHHWGYHYPRSSGTVADIRNATADFEARYESAIIRDVATYYCVATEGSKVTPERYLDFCREHGLPFEVETPSSEYMDPSRISLCLKTFEPIYHYSRLKEVTKRLLSEKKRLRLLFSCTVIGGRLEANGTKTLSYQHDGVMRYDTFDEVINVTYANHNLVPSWLGFAPKLVRVDLVEALIMKIPMPRMSFAVMDGPFTNVVPTETDGIFTLVHISESVLKRFVPPDGLIPPGLTYASNAKQIISKSAEWFPFLAKGEYLESRYVFRSVNANREHDDARPSDIAEHGFGCRSILGGKIVNCVSVAKKIREAIDRDVS